MSLHTRNVGDIIPSPVCILQFLNSATCVAENSAREGHLVREGMLVGFSVWVEDRFLVAAVNFCQH